jgi:hypothetical protein
MAEPHTINRGEAAFAALARDEPAYTSEIITCFFFETDWTTPFEKSASDHILSLMAHLRGFVLGNLRRYMILALRNASCVMPT